MAQLAKSSSREKWKTSFLPNVQKANYIIRLFSNKGQFMGKVEGHGQEQYRGRVEGHGQGQCRGIGAGAVQGQS